MNIEESKAKILSEIPSSYSPLLHGIIVGFFSLFFIGYAIYLAGWSCLEGICLFLLVFTTSEWLIHRFLLHRPTIKFLFKFHQKHHMLYQTKSMQIQSYRELYWVLFPISIFFAMTFVTLAAFVLLFVFVSIKLAAILLFNVFFFFLVYEACHTMWHTCALNEWSRNHAEHHDFKIMNKRKMNVVLPIIDLVVDKLFPTKSDGNQDGT